MNHLPFLIPPSATQNDAQVACPLDVGQLDLGRVAEHIAEARKRGTYIESDDPLAYLQSRGCMVTVGGVPCLTLAGLLCFGRSPQEIQPNAAIDLRHHRDAHTRDQNRIGGTLFDQLAAVEEFLWQNTTHTPTVSKITLQRVEADEYPRAVIRALSVQMVVYRGYTRDDAAACVRLWANDRIEWIIPGASLPLFPPRNPSILRVLSDVGLVGSFEPEATISTEGRSLVMTVQGQHVEPTDLSIGQQQIILLAHYGTEVTPRAILAALPERSKRGIQRDLRALLDKGLLVGHGNTRTRRYTLAQ